MHGVFWSQNDPEMGLKVDQTLKKIYEKFLRHD